MYALSKSTTKYRIYGQNQPGLLLESKGSTICLGNVVSESELVRTGRENQLLFKDRVDAGQKLGKYLANSNLRDAIVLALPRGGVPVGSGVARALNAPLDVLVARKLGVPGHGELGFGAIAEGDVTVLNKDLVERLRLTPNQIDLVIAKERVELDRRVTKYRQGRELPDLRGRLSILVDDGLATGYTARAGLEALGKMGASRMLLAVPVGSRDTLTELRRDGYEVVCLEVPHSFMAVGQWYEEFSQTSDSEVLTLLSDFHGNCDTEASRVVIRDVSIPVDGKVLKGTLTSPLDVRALVVFAHGSGSSRLSPRNIEVAEALNDSGFATLLFDLLTPDEANDRRNVFDIPLLASRLIAASNWIERESDTKLQDLPLFYFGASTGAAAALVAAAQLGSKVEGVISRGGRPDLAGAALARVVAPVLLIVGGADREVLILNQQAAQLIRSAVELVVVPRAGHLFEEPGALGEVARVAASWLRDLVEQLSRDRDE